MYQGADGIQIFETPDFDLTGKKVYMTFTAINGKSFTKTQPEIIVDENQIAVRFRQKDTLDFPEGPMRIEVRWIDESGETGKTDLATMPIEGVMNRNVITYEEDTDE